MHVTLCQSCPTVSDQLQLMPCLCPEPAVASHVQVSLRKGLLCLPPFLTHAPFIPFPHRLAAVMSAAGCAANGGTPKPQSRRRQLADLATLDASSCDGALRSSMPLMCCADLLLPAPQTGFLSRTSPVSRWLTHFRKLCVRCAVCEATQAATSASSALKISFSASGSNDGRVPNPNPVPHQARHMQLAETGHCCAGPLL